jgi:predicted type IV restriction endonuclease
VNTAQQDRLMGREVNPRKDAKLAAKIEAHERKLNQKRPKTKASDRAVDPGVIWARNSVSHEAGRVTVLLDDEPDGNIFGWPLRNR